MNVQQQQQQQQEQQEQTTLFESKSCIIDPCTIQSKFKLKNWEKKHTWENIQSQLWYNDTRNVSPASRRVLDEYFDQGRPSSDQVYLGSDTTLLEHLYCRMSRYVVVADEYLTPQVLQVPGRHQRLRRECYPTLS